MVSLLVFSLPVVSLLMVSLHLVSLLVVSLHLVSLPLSRDHWNQQFQIGSSSLHSFLPRLPIPIVPALILMQFDAPLNS